MSVGVGEVKLSCERGELEIAGVGGEAEAVAWLASGWMIGARGKPWIRVAGESEWERRSRRVRETGGGFRDMDMCVCVICASGGGQRWQ
jgi:hypothetical protein